MICRRITGSAWGGFARLSPAISGFFQDLLSLISLLNEL